VLKEEYILTDVLVKRDFRIAYEGVEKIVSQIQMLNWPDHCQPDDYTTIEKLIEFINVYRANFQTPILIHCSAGIGRTGTFIAIYNLIKCLHVEHHQGRSRLFFSVFNIVRKLREQRFGMVTAFNQYKYIYDYTIDYIRRNCRVPILEEYN
jgi:protein tyrosine phosphatase